MAMPKTIVLGSGKFYGVEYTDGELPETATIAVDGNRIGAVKGGATLTYTPTYTTAKDDLGEVTLTRLTEEEAKFKTGLITWDAATLKKLFSTGVITSTTSLTTLKIGGIGNDDGKKYAFCFVHDASDQNKNLVIRFVGKNEAGFSISFNPTDPTTVDTEFTCQSGWDDDGTLAVYTEETKAEG